MAIFYADSAGTQGTGTGVSAANACTLKQFIEDDAILYQAVAAGDDCFCKNGTTITFDSSSGVYATFAVAGTSTAPVRIVGYNTVITDEGIVEMLDSNGGAGSFPFNFNNLDYIHMSNFRLTDTNRFDLGSVDGYVLYNIHMVDPISRGFDENGATGVRTSFINCSVDGSSGNGFDILHRAATLLNCIAKNCTVDGFKVGNAYGANLKSCISSKNGGIGFNLVGDGFLYNCIADDNNDDGFYIDAANTTVLENCGITNNGAYGITGDSGADVILLNCGFYLNTSGNINTTNINVLQNTGEQTADPKYTNQSTGDYTLQSDSPWIDAGNGYNG